MTQRTENLLGVLALLVTDEMNAQNTVAALAGPTARAMLNAVGQYPDSSIEVLRDAVDLSHPAAVRAVAARGQPSRRGRTHRVRRPADQDSLA
jgi:hypothetical protein